MLSGAQPMCDRSPMGLRFCARILACGVAIGGGGTLGCAKASSAPADASGTGNDGVIFDAPTDAPPDAAPGSVAVSITPAMPRTLDDLTAVVVAGVNPPAYTLRWTRGVAVQPALTGLVVGNALTAKGDAWSVDLVDAGGNSLAHAAVTIANTPPLPAIAGLPPSPLPGSAIQCLLAGGAVDPDGDPITYSAQWTRNAAPFTAVTSTTITGDTVPAGISINGDTFACTVFASDGTDTTASLPAMAHPSCAGHIPPPAVSDGAGTHRQADSAARRH